MKSKHIQEFLVRAGADRPISGQQLLDTLLGIRMLPGWIEAITCGNAEDAPDLYRHALERFAERRGMVLIEKQKLLVAIDALQWYSEKPNLTQLLPDCAKRAQTALALIERKGEELKYATA